ncbi:N-ATPase subunit AtpR [Roseisalinus antarcticus]|nr:ATP synthase subunit I [Roseisalinus antarcticus]
MTELVTLADLLWLPLFLVGGVLLGLGYFAALQATAALIVGGGAPLVALGLTLARLAALGAGLLLAVQWGALALLATAAGVVLGRMAMLRQGRGGAS